MAKNVGKQHHIKTSIYFAIFVTIGECHAGLHQLSRIKRRGLVGYVCKRRGGGPQSYSKALFLFHWWGNISPPIFSWLWNPPHWLTPFLPPSLHPNAALLVGRPRTGWRIRLRKRTANRLDLRRPDETPRRQSMSRSRGTKMLNEGDAP